MAAAGALFGSQGEGEADSGIGSEVQALRKRQHFIF
jgi:hypothetical protein